MDTEEKSNFKNKGISKYRSPFNLLTGGLGYPTDALDKVQKEKGGAKQDTNPTIIQNNQPNQSIIYMPYLPTLEPLKPCPVNIREMLLNTLTPRQREILRRYCKSEYVKTIALEMGMPHITFQRELREIKNKFYITTSKPNETRIILSLCFRFKIASHILPKLLFWAKDNYGFQSDVYKWLNEIYQNRLKEENAKAT